MGLGNIFGSGSQQTKVKLPGYLDDTAKAIGYDTKYLVDQQTKNPLNSTQSDALNGIIDKASQGSPFVSGAEDWYGGVMGNGGLTGEQAALASNLISGQAANPAMAETQRIAMGGDLGSNPFLDQTYDQAAKRVTDNFNQNVIPGMDNQFAAAGRLGSKAYAQSRNQAENYVGDQLNNLATQVYGGAYQSDQANKMAALGQLGQLGQQDVNNQLAGAGLQSTGQQFQQSAIGLTPTLQGLEYDDLTRKLNAGTTLQQAPWLPLQQGASVIGGLPGGQTQTASTNLSTGQQVMQGLGTAAMIGGFAMSDRQLKRDISRIGSRANGLAVYSYRYWDDAPEELRIGYMAQEVLHVCPEAVHEVGGHLCLYLPRIA